MRPRNARRINRAIIAAALTALTLAGTGAARADGVLSPVEQAYVLTYHNAVCWTLDEYPTRAGVMGIAEAIVNDGLTPTDAVDVINASVEGWCDRHWPLLVAVGREAREGTARYIA